MGRIAPRLNNYLGEIPGVGPFSHVLESMPPHLWACDSSDTLTSSLIQTFLGLLACVSPLVGGLSWAFA